MRRLVSAVLVAVLSSSAPAAARFGTRAELKPTTGAPLKSVSDLRKNPPHPVELGAYTVGKPLIALLGKDLDTVSGALSGPGWGKIAGSFYVGTACMAHACSDADALVVISLSDLKPLVAWRSFGEASIRPSARDWPAEAVPFLDLWRAHRLR